VKNSRNARIRRHTRIRKKVRGSSERPRISVFKSTKHIYAQLINDDEGSTVVSVCTMDKEIRDAIKHGGNVEAAKKVGEALGKRAAEKGVRLAVFDRGGYPYHGRIKALADSARESGLSF